MSSVGKAARAIIIERGKLLVMHRNKHGSEYFTLVGGRVNEDEAPEQALKREIKEETGMDVTAIRQVFIETHTAPYNEQHIFLCEVAPHGPIAIQDTSEEGAMNKMALNVHKPLWVSASAFANLPFRTPQLQNAIVRALGKGFPGEPVQL